MTLSNGEAGFNALLCIYKSNADLYNRVFELTAEQFRHLTQQNCFYCGRKPRQKKGSKKHGYYFYNGLDRVDNSGGYTIDNVVPCCAICNRAKKNLAQVTFLQWIKDLVQNFEEKILGHISNG